MCRPGHSIVKAGEPMCTEGSWWKAADGCNTCSCMGGQAACTLKLCLPARPVRAADLRGGRRLHGALQHLHLRGRRPQSVLQEGLQPCCGLLQHLLRHRCLHGRKQLQLVQLRQRQPRVHPQTLLLNWAPSNFASKLGTLKLSFKLDTLKLSFKMDTLKLSFKLNT